MAIFTDDAFRYWLVGGITLGFFWNLLPIFLSRRALIRLLSSDTGAIIKGWVALALTALVIIIWVARSWREALISATALFFAASIGHLVFRAAMPSVMSRLTPSDLEEIQSARSRANETAK